jgi:hypothetical protein
MSGIFFIASIVCFIIGLVQLFTPEPASASASGSRADKGVSAWPRPDSVGMPASGFRSNEKPSTISPISGFAAAGQDGSAKPLKLDWIELGQRIVIRHPQREALMLHVLGRILYVELWQRTRGSQSPWVPTGSAFYGFLLEGGRYLLNWQTRYYLLDERVEITDNDIQRDFLPHARKFAQSDQTAEVYFDYPPAVWHIDDIGKFRIAEATGEAGRFRLGAVGRFIHSSGDSQRALVVEDYEGGSGQDVVWTGWQIQEADIALS